MNHPKLAAIALLGVFAGSATLATPAAVPRPHATHPGPRGRKEFPMRSALFVGLSLLLAAVAAEAAPLTYDAALEAAERTAPGLQAKAADVRAARSAAIAAGRLPDP